VAVYQKCPNVMPIALALAGTATPDEAGTLISDATLESLSAATNKSIGIIKGNLLTLVQCRLLLPLAHGAGFELVMP
jgi:hypothetical protein